MNTEQMNEAEENVSIDLEESGSVEVEQKLQNPNNCPKTSNLLLRAEAMSLKIIATMLRSVLISLQPSASKL